MQNIKVIGCGVIGLTTAIRLQQAGYTVEIITKSLPPETTSAIAAAIWLPFEAEPIEKVNYWSLFTYNKFETLCNEPEAGVYMVDLTVLDPKEQSPTRKSALPNGRIRKASIKELPTPYQFGHVVTVPMIETPVYLNYLLHKFENNGGHLILKEISSLEGLGDGNQWIINCTGLEAEILTDDSSLFPIRGQLIKVPAIPGLKYIVDDEGPNAVSYVLPRQDCTILGGTAQKGKNQLSPDPQDTRDILMHCRNIEPGIGNQPVLDILVGLRPGRDSIRLEKEKKTRIIHNYGHGGSGFTVSWGCAEDVLNIIQEMK